MRSKRLHPNARNFGLASRDMAVAGRNAVREGYLSKSSINTQADRFSLFSAYSLKTWKIRDMRKLRVSHIQQYGAYLLECTENTEISPRTAQNRLSAVNRVLEIARADKYLWVAPVKDAGLPRVSGICKECLAPSLDAWKQALRQVPGRLSAQMELQRMLGLRFEESCKINSNEKLKQAMTSGQIDISEGTKGGRKRNLSNVSREQISALKIASAIQGKARSMIPSNMVYRTYRDQCYDELRGTTLSGFHGGRHCYAHNRYMELTGAACPVIAEVSHGNEHHQYLARTLAVPIEQAREIDGEARRQIAAELGHNRSNITNSYLG